MGIFVQRGFCPEEGGICLGCLCLGSLTRVRGLFLFRSLCQGKGVSDEGRGLCPGRGSLSSKEISAGEGVSVKGGGLCPGGSLFSSLCPGERVSPGKGVSFQGMGSLSRERVSIQGVSVQGVCPQAISVNWRSLSRRVSLSRWSLSGGLSPGHGDLCSEGFLSRGRRYLSRVSLGSLTRVRGLFLFRSLCQGKGVSDEGRGLCPGRGSLSSKGVSVQRRGCLSREEVCVQGISVQQSLSRGLCPWGLCSGRGLCPVG